MIALKRDADDLRVQATLRARLEALSGDLALEVLIDEMRCEFSMPIVMLNMLLREERIVLRALGVRDAGPAPRAETICNRVIRADGPLIVEDAAADPACSALPGVVGGPKIRFYAGVPIKVSGGFAMGALCMMDTVPRTLDQAARLRFEACAMEVQWMVQQQAMTQRMLDMVAVGAMPRRSAAPSAAVCCVSRRAAHA